ncbi:equilibrative nucleoside transporter 1-like [Anoplophora glabripennis]|uniref:equilibrative nucleoside transporter 1-like n=1 Tax=Anoplophora glabripennis TaxID=217634 RepID=UPI000874B820|nr:equilibrative nucleoside transporter 1-like [Anoplophora glabripennis]XP_023311373.1 equilibrative nucleoside transporter 1-like [Anoplophora glabripennis]XP_023311374.1 equilibrative nucleoside transporter 1-like [Anoplophora glabripennis]
MSYNKDYLYNETNGVPLQPIQDAEVTEKTCLQQPTKQQLSWEEKELQEDELNFKNLTVDETSLPLSSPPDTNNLVYFTFLIHGIGVLMPWNMFINANEYFTNYKLSPEYIGFIFPYVPNFMQYLTFSAQVPSVLFNWMNVFVTIGGSLTTRIVCSITVEVIVFIITVILAMVDSSTWPHGFFYVTMICVVILNMANGIYQNSIYGMAAKLPGKYTGAVILGNNISGTFTAVVNLLSSLMTSNTRMAAIYYFITALFILVICFVSYFTLQRNRFYRHFELKEKKDVEQRRQLMRGSSERPPYLYILKKSLPQLYNVFFVFFVTLAVFPAIHADIKPVDENFFIPLNYYASITCFITFNVFAMIGSWLPSYFIWPKPKYLWIPVTLRILYIPFYLFCNYQVKGLDRILPVLVTNDLVYWVVAATMGITNGYFSSLAMMYTPRMVEERYATTAGMLAAAALITGIFTGIISSFLWPWVIANVG